MTKEEFEERYIKGSNLTKEEYDKELITMPCKCSASNCKGWAAVYKSPLSIKAHKDLYMRGDNSA